MNKKGIVYNIAFNDADYTTNVHENIGGKSTLVWRCPFYIKWKDMLKRCYSKPHKISWPTYQGCSVSEEWLYFMTFRAWMEKQDWQNKHLDKDILFPGNKVYSAETCVFVDPKVNMFLLDCGAARGEWPIGVYRDKSSNKFIARCRRVQDSSVIWLGSFQTPEEAHEAWLCEKLKQARILANQQTDSRVAEAIIKRYENYEV